MPDQAKWNNDEFGSTSTVHHLPPKQANQNLLQEVPILHDVHNGVRSQCTEGVPVGQVQPGSGGPPYLEGGHLQDVDPEPRATIDDTSGELLHGSDGEQNRQSQSKFPLHTITC